MPLVPTIEPRDLPLCSRVLHRLSYSPAADLETERERHLTTGKCAKRTKLDFRCPICRTAIGQAKTSLSDARQPELRPSQKKQPQAKIARAFLFGQLHFNNVTSHALFYGGHLVMRSKRCAMQNQGITLKAFV